MPKASPAYYEGATGTEYELEAADLGSRLRVTVTASNTGGSIPAGSAASAEVKAGAPSATSSTTITTLRRGGPDCETGAGLGRRPCLHMNGNGVSRRFSATSNARPSMARPDRNTRSAKQARTQPADHVRPPIAEGSAESEATSDEVEPGPPAELSAPSIAGTTEAGSTLTANNGEWSAAEASYGYQWESCNVSGGECEPIEGATEREYEFGEGDIGTTLEVQVTVTGSAGSTQVSSAASAAIRAEAPRERQAPSVAGTPDAGEVLYADPESGPGPKLALLPVESCDGAGAECSPIEGATEAEYALGEGDVANTLRVRVGVSDSLDSITDVSPATAVIGSYGALVNTALPSIPAPRKAVEHCLRNQAPGRRAVPWAIPTSGRHATCSAPNATTSKAKAPPPKATRRAALTSAMPCA